MASLGPNSPTSGVDNDAIGTVAWSNPENITSSNDAYATATVDAGAQTHYLQASGFNFNIPEAATIDGIVVQWEKKKTGSGDGTRDNAIRIVKGGVIGSVNKATNTEWPTSDTYVSYGGTTDKWGETWTPDDINSADFGAVLSGKEVNGNLFNLLVDHCRITVHYTDATPEWMISLI